MREISELRRLIEVYDAAISSRQSVENEVALTRLSNDIKRLKCIVELERIRLFGMLLDSYMDTGQATLMRKDGSRKKAEPAPATSSMQTYWNIESELYRVVDWKLNEED